MMLRAFIAFVIFAVVLLGLPRIYTELTTRGKIYSSGSVPSDRVAIVFGAGLQRDGTPSPILVTGLQLQQHCILMERCKNC